MTETNLIILLSAVVAILGIVVTKRKVTDIVKWALKVDGKVDDKQVRWSRVASSLSKRQEPAVKVSLFHHLAAIAVDDALADATKLVDIYEDDHRYFEATRENFLWQVPLRVASADDLPLFAAAVAKEPKLMVAVAEIQAAAK